MKRNPEKFLFRVAKGALQPADEYTALRLREKGYVIGDVLSATLKKARNPAYFRLIHALGKLVADNIEAFKEMDAHSVLKRIQLESGIACDEIAIRVPGYGMMMHRVPKSLSFESMDEGQFQEAVKGFCRHIAQNYWVGLNEDQIFEMAQMMP